MKPIRTMPTTTIELQAENARLRAEIADMQAENARLRQQLAEATQVNTLLHLYSGRASRRLQEAHDVLEDAGVAPMIRRRIADLLAKQPG